MERNSLLVFAGTAGILAVALALLDLIWRRPWVPVVVAGGAVAALAFEILTEEERPAMVPA